jgi:hypothetical protein
MPFIGRIGTSASQDRLESLIEERLKPGADKERIDERIWDLFGEHWAVMFTDLAGFSRRVPSSGLFISCRSSTSRSASWCPGHAAHLTRLQPGPG